MTESIVKEDTVKILKASWILAVSMVEGEHNSPAVNGALKCIRARLDKLGVMSDHQSTAFRLIDEKFTSDDDRWDRMYWEDRG